MADIGAIIVSKWLGGPAFLVQAFFDGAAAGSASAAGTLGALGDLTGAASGSATAAGSIKGTLAAAGAASGAAAAAGALVQQYAVTGAAVGVGLAAGDLDVIGSVALDGSAAGTGEAAGELTLYPHVNCPPIGRTPSGCNPVIRDHDHLISHGCETERGGTKVAGAPSYVLVVRNPSGNDFLPGS